MLRFYGLRFSPLYHGVTILTATDRNHSILCFKMLAVEKAFELELQQYEAFKVAPVTLCTR